MDLDGNGIITGY